MTLKSQNRPVERYRSIPTAADELGLKVHALRRAINNGDIPSYTPFGTRRYVLISEIIAVISASKIGGAQ